MTPLAIVVHPTAIPVSEPIVSAPVGGLPSVAPEADSSVTVGGLRKKATKEQTKERLNALLTLALRRSDSSGSSARVYVKKKGAAKKQAEGKKGKGKKKKKTKLQASSESDEAEPAEDDADRKLQLDSMLFSIAQVLGVDSVSIVATAPVLDESLINKYILYVQQDGFHFYSVTQHFPAAQKMQTGKRKGGANYNYEVKAEYGEAVGKLLNYVLSGSFWRGEAINDVGDWAVLCLD